MKVELVAALVGLAGLPFLLTGTGLLLSQYLERGGIAKSSQDDISEGISKLGKVLETRLEEIRDFTVSGGVILSVEERETLISSISKTVDRELGAGLLQKIDETYGASVMSSGRVDAIRHRFIQTTERLRREIDALGRRGNLNLILGSLTTMTGLAVLAYMVFTAKLDPTHPASIFGYYIPRTTLVIFIEVFAYFFLRLYKSSLAEIKYFQNELTNAELKFLSLEGTFLHDDKDALQKILLGLAKTERNFVLEKGQTTIELEKDKNETAYLRDAITLVGDITKAKTKAKE